VLEGRDLSAEGLFLPDLVLDRVPAVRHSHDPLLVGVQRGHDGFGVRLVSCCWWLSLGVLRVAGAVEHFVEVEAGVVGRSVVSFIMCWVLRGDVLVDFVQLELARRLLLPAALQVEVVKVGLVLERDVVCKLALPVQYLPTHRPLQNLLKLLHPFSTYYLQKLLEVDLIVDGLQRVDYRRSLPLCPEHQLLLS